MKAAKAGREPMELKDSGSRQSFESGAVRDIQQGKGRFDLIPFEGLEAVAQVFEAGAVKYGERNWEKGIPVSRYIDSMLRHATKAANGMTDEPHLAQAAWNALCAIATIARRPDLDDRPGSVERRLDNLRVFAEENARQASETLKSCLEEIEAQENGFIPDMNTTVYRKLQPFNPIPLTDGKIPECVEEVWPYQAWERYNKGQEVEKGKDGDWIPMPWVDGAGSLPYQWFMEEFERGWRYRIRIRKA